MPPTQDWRLEGGLSAADCCLACLGLLVSHKTVSISALMGCCCAGLGMRHSPSRLARARCSLSDILGCSVPGLPGQSCLLPGGGRGETFVNKTVTWDRQLCQAGPG